VKDLEEKVRKEMKMKGDESFVNLYIMTNTEINPYV